VVVAGHVIPPGTTVQIPVWSSACLHHNVVVISTEVWEQYIVTSDKYFFPDPDVFWPERWMPEGKTIADARGEEFRLDQRAYHPYSSGPHSLPSSPRFAC
jgi:hypothetical protein